jgi:hypothetical protein
MKARFWLGLHIFIIVNFVVEICYSGYMVFVIFSPESGGPLMGSALSFPAELMQTRRLYALECWVAISGLSIYLAITEIRPRLRPSLNESPR